MTVTESTYAWLTWGVMNVPHGDLSPDVSARIDADRKRAKSLRVLGPSIPIKWAYDSNLIKVSRGPTCQLRKTWRRVARYTHEGREVYLEAFGGIGGGPGFGFREVRLYINKTIVGRAWVGGCSLGFGGSVGPAIALLGEGLALRVTVPFGWDQEPETVQLLGA